MKDKKNRIHRHNLKRIKRSNRVQVKSMTVKKMLICFNYLKIRKKEHSMLKTTRKTLLKKKLMEKLVQKLRNNNNISKWNKILVMKNLKRNLHKLMVRVNKISRNSKNLSLKSNLSLKMMKKRKKRM